MNKAEWDKANQNRTGCLLGCGCFSFLIMVGGGITMATLYEKGQPLDARAYWILGSMLAPFVPLALMVVIWRLPPNPGRGCPNCGRDIHVELEHNSRSGRCPACGANIFKVVPKGDTDRKSDNEE